MVLLVVADDFTGALDTGIQFKKNGIKTLVKVGEIFELTEEEKSIPILVVDVESRHIPAKKAYERVRVTVRKGIEYGAKYVYKKTDSALRGNVGAELAGAIDGMGGGPLCFIPAFPEMGRVTAKGVQYFEKKPISESVFGEDPFEPVTNSFIPEIVSRQTDIPIRLIPTTDLHGCMDSPNKREILIFDSESKNDLQVIADELKRTGKIRLTAGCAGFAEIFSSFLKKKDEREVLTHFVPKGTIVVSGSLNPITIAQTQYCGETGFRVVTLTPEQKLDSDYTSSEECRSFLADLLWNYQRKHRLLIESVHSRKEIAETSQQAKKCGLNLEHIRTVISNNIALLTVKFLEVGADGVLVVFGGDTVISIIQKMKYSGIVPYREIVPGVVMSYTLGGLKSCWLVTKSGGFGEPDIISQIEKYLQSFGAN